ncbi:MAG: hypothetical protein KAH77_06190 [Thiomargarita sp.]|nr:hypothetical protein [Bacteroidales bacterium]MCK5717064.1 hypothetical protein [Thiomargarita sp.]
MNKKNDTKLKKIFSNNFLMSAMAVGCVILGIFLSFVWKDFTWFSRFGSILVGIGIILLSRTFIIGVDLHIPVVMQETGLNVYERAHHEKLDDTIPKFVIEEEKSRFAIGVLSPTISFLGTLIWGFGDLLNRLFNWC